MIRKLVWGIVLAVWTLILCVGGPRAFSADVPGTMYSVRFASHICIVWHMGSRGDGGAQRVGGISCTPLALLPDDWNSGPTTGELRELCKVCGCMSHEEHCAIVGAPTGVEVMR